MDEHTIYVMLRDERWAVSVGGNGPATPYPDRATAIAAARRACRHKWEIEGTPCTVRVRAEDGQWQDAELYGAAWG